MKKLTKTEQVLLYFANVGPQRIIEEADFKVMTDKYIAVQRYAVHDMINDLNLKFVESKSPQIVFSAALRWKEIFIAIDASNYFFYSTIVVKNMGLRVKQIQHEGGIYSFPYKRFWKNKPHDFESDFLDKTGSTGFWPEIWDEKFHKLTGSMIIIQDRIRAEHG